MQSPAELRENLKKLIVERLNLIDITPDDIGDEMSLFKTGPRDWIQSTRLELTLNVEKEYGVKVANSEQALQAFQSVATLAGFIEQHQPGGELTAAVTRVPVSGNTPCLRFEVAPQAGGSATIVPSPSDEFPPFSIFPLPSAVGVASTVRPLFAEGVVAPSRTVASDRGTQRRAAA